MTQRMMPLSANPNVLRFAVVITDGHVTGEPCNKVKPVAEKAREHMKIFVIAASKNVEENVLTDIASTPASVYRRDYKVVDLSQGRATIHTETIDHIIKTMVTHKDSNTETQEKPDTQPMPLLLTHCSFCLHRNIWRT